jgi:hypothetical protein
LLNGSELSQVLSEPLGFVAVAGAGALEHQCQTLD